MAEPLPALSPPRKKSGPKTPEGKARSRMNALRHGLRAREFGLLPEESPTEWAEHLADLRAALGAADAYEEKLVAGLAAAMWKEIRADRVECDVMAEIPPLPNRHHGGDLQEPRHAASLTTAVRYQTAAGMAVQRAQRALLVHRKARKDGFAPAVTAAAPTPVANQNELGDPSAADGPPRLKAKFCMNEFLARHKRTQPTACIENRPRTTRATQHRRGEIAHRAQARPDPLHAPAVRPRFARASGSPRHLLLLTNPSTPPLTPPRANGAPAPSAPALTARHSRNCTNEFLDWH